MKRFDAPIAQVTMSMPGSEEDSLSFGLLFRHKFLNTLHPEVKRFDDL
ncbi:hypothetical protein [Streptomyces sp. NPDC002463]